MVSDSSNQKLNNMNKKQIDKTADFKVLFNKEEERKTRRPRIKFGTELGDPTKFSSTVHTPDKDKRIDI